MPTWGEACQLRKPKLCSSRLCYDGMHCSIQVRFEDKTWKANKPSHHPKVILIAVALHSLMFVPTYLCSRTLLIKVFWTKSDYKGWLCPFYRSRNDSQGREFVILNGKVQGGIQDDKKSFVFSLSCTGVEEMFFSVDDEETYYNWLSKLQTACGAGTSSTFLYVRLLLIFCNF